MALQQYRPRQHITVEAMPLNLPQCEMNYQKWGGIQSAKVGDWLVNQAGEFYTVEKDSFKKTYSHINANTYKKTASVWAQAAEQPGAITTKEGKTDYQVGDMLVYNNPDGTDGYAMPKAEFTSRYELVDATDKEDLPMDSNSTFSLSVDGYIKQRLDDQISWYEKKSAHNQRCFKRCQLWAIIFGAAIPLLTAVSFEELEVLLRFTIALLGSLIAIMNAVISLYKYQENWAQYRATAEALIREKFLFLTRAAPYTDTEESNFQQLVERCETIMSSENISWLKQFSKQKETKKSESTEKTKKAS